MKNSFDIVRDFERAICEYTGAPFAVTTRTCTDALMLCVLYLKADVISIPRFTYRGVAQAIQHAHAFIEFDDREWSGSYTLDPYPIKDSARRFTSGMYSPGYFECCSFHWEKILPIQQGGVILHDRPEAQRILQMMTRDGAHWDTPLAEQEFVEGYNCYMAPETAAAGLRRLESLPKTNSDLPNSAYTDLSKQKLFRPTPVRRIHHQRIKNNDRWMALLEHMVEIDPIWAQQWQDDVDGGDRKISQINKSLVA